MHKLSIALALAALTATSLQAQTVHVTSDILGMCDTGNKTTLKKDLIYTHGPGDINLYHYDASGKRVIYENEKDIKVPLEPVHYKGSAVIDLGNVDDALIDASHARVTLLEGSVNRADELILKADKLDGPWKNGKYVYTLKDGDLEFNTWGYDTSTDYNSGREWSIMGGDGNGVYALRFQVSGIRYNGKELPAAEFPVTVYCYGRTCTDMSLGIPFVENGYDKSYTSGLRPAADVQWKWFTEGAQSAADKPYMNDTFADYFTVVWPKGTDASGVNASDVRVTLTSPYGDRYVLSTETAYGEHEYAVISGKSETTVAVLYQQWSYAPVYNELTIEVSRRGKTLAQTWPIASVGVYAVQTGGGGVDVDHTVTCYNHYGLKGLTMDNAIGRCYTLSTEIDGQTWYYAEDENGNGYLSKAVASQGRGGFGGPGPQGGFGGPQGRPGGMGPGGSGQGGTGRGPQASAPADAWKGDGTDIWHLAVLGNVVFVETRMDTPEETVTTEDKIVDGKTITFKRNRESDPRTEAMLENGVTLKPGFNTVRSAASKWAWTMRYQSGWTIYSPQPDGLPAWYPYGYAPGSENPAYIYEKSL